VPARIGTPARCNAATVARACASDRFAPSSAGIFISSERRIDGVILDINCGLFCHHGVSDPSDPPGPSGPFGASGLFGLFVRASMTDSVATTNTRRRAAISTTSGAGGESAKMCTRPSTPAVMAPRASLCVLM